MQELAAPKVSTRRPAVPNHVDEDACRAPEVLHRALDSLWSEAVRRSRGIPEEGFGAVEKDFRERLLKLGALVLGEALPTGLGTGYGGSSIGCRECGGRARFVNCRPRTVTTLVQEVRVARAYYHCGRCGHGEAPLDGQLGLNGTSFSPGVREAICLLDAEVAFERGSTMLERLSAIRLDKQEGRRLAEELGRELERETVAEVEATWRPGAPAPRETTESARRLYLSPDGTTAPMLAGWKEVKLGAVFTGSVPQRGEEPERLRTRYVGTVGDAEEVWRRMYVEALKLGLSEGTEVAVIADGASWIWRKAEETLPKERVEILDFYHATEKLWEVSRAAFGDENPRGKAWAERWSRKLYESDAGPVMAALRRLRPRDPAAREVVRTTLGYYRSHRRRMRYRAFRAKGYFIGSGVVESGCKHLVGARLKQAGMRWTPEGAQAILQLRLAMLNDRWDCRWGSPSRG